MPPSHQFQHLPLLLRYRGDARIRGGGAEAPQTATNKANRAVHSGTLRGSAGSATAAWRAQRTQREQQGLPVLPKDIPLLLQVDPGLDLDALRERFGFEIVAEHEDGFVIVAAQDIDLTTFLQAVNDFAADVLGSANVAKIHSLQGPENQDARLRRILSESLHEQWPNLQESAPYLVDVGIECQGTVEIPDTPVRGKREQEPRWAHRMREWGEARDQAYQAWDELQLEREGEVGGLIGHYGGQIHRSTQPDSGERFPDQFTVRIEVTGKGLRDLVLNYPFVFEVVEPDDVLLPQQVRAAMEGAATGLALQPPPESAPAVCVIDSGIQEQHPLLSPAIDAPESRCFLPGRNPTDVADEVAPSGHGTRVAGAVLYGESIPDPGGAASLDCWLQNARLLDQQGQVPRTLFPPDGLRAIVNHFHRGKRRTRIFNHSLGARAPCRQRLMSAWAAEIDNLCAHNDLLFVVTSGNVPDTQPNPHPGVREHLVAGREYPAYLHENACRVATPGQSLQALTVGSVAYEAYNAGGWRSLAPGAGHPSGFSRTGPGIWGVIKPEVVEFGGDMLVSGGNPPTVGTPDAASQCYPDLVLSTMHGPRLPHARDGAVGTSFSAPKVSRIAARLQSILPDEPCLLYRALLVQSARWPAWAADLTPEQQVHLLRQIGYGIPDMGRATTNTDHRVTLISNGEQQITAGECHIFQVPIPAAMRAQGEEYEVLVEVTLSYAAQPRRTRRHLRRYLSTWVDWKSSKLGEALETFRGRALKDQPDDGSQAQGSVLPWMLHEMPQWGTLRSVKRNAGTVQKDWAVVRSNTLPDHFCIAVVGHKGWSHDPDATARYAIVVSFEILGKEIPIYEPLMAEVQQLQAQIEAEAEAAAEIEVET